MLTILIWKIPIVAYTNTPNPTKYPTSGAPLMSRWSMVFSIRSYPYAREQGMGAAFANLAPKHVTNGSLKAS